MSLKVFAVFLVMGNEFGYAEFDFLGAALSKEGVDKIITIAEQERTTDVHFDLIHQSMNGLSHFTYYGDRDTLDKYCDIDCFGGMIIEEIMVLE